MGEWEWIKKLFEKIVKLLERDYGDKQALNIYDLIQKECLRTRTDADHKWQYELAYLTDEDVATPKGVKKFVMDTFEQLK